MPDGIEDNRVRRHCSRLLSGLACAIAAFAPGHRSQAATADECLPKLRAELNVGLTGTPLVSLTINGNMAHLLLDTGAEKTTLTETAARRLGLLAEADPAQPASAAARPAPMLKPDQVAAGGRPLPGISFSVVADPPARPDSQPVDGVLGADALSAYDLDVNLGHHLILLYEPSRCEVPTLPWRRPFEEVEAKFSSHRHLSFPITLDGQKLTAFVDSGSQVSIVDAATAGRLGITPASLEQDLPLWPKAAPADEASAKKHRFAKLVLAGSALLSPTLGVMTMRLPDADMRMGYDVLARERIWVSYATHRIFVERPG